MAVVQEFLKANDAYASTFKKGELVMPPARHVAVLVCMDARIDPARAVCGTRERRAETCSRSSPCSRTVMVTPCSP